MSLKRKRMSKRVRAIALRLTNVRSYREWMAVVIRDAQRHLATKDTP